MERINLDGETLFLLNKNEYDTLKGVYSFLNNVCYQVCFKKRGISKEEITTRIKLMKEVLYD